MNARILFYLRLLIAVAFTVGILPYCWDRSLVMWMMTGTVDWRFAGLFVVGLVVTAMVVRDLASQFTSPTVRAAILPSLLVIWVVEHAVLVWMSAGDLSPRPALWARRVRKYHEARTQSCGNYGASTLTWPPRAARR